MRYTRARVTPSGIVLWAYHLRRLEPELGEGSRAQQALLDFARGAGPGVWALWVDHQQGLRAERKPGSRLVEGMPSRKVQTPLASDEGEIAKPASPGIYDGVRVEGLASLLVSVDGTEILEACSAAVVAWDDGLVMAPRGRARVASTSEAAIREHLSVREAPIAAGSTALLLVNAVKGTCEPAGCEGFPASARSEIEALFARLTSGPSPNPGAPAP